MSYTPNETPAQLFAEEAWLAGALITATGYGIVSALFWLCCHALWIRLKRKDSSRKRNIFFLVYVCILFAFGSLFLGSNSQFTQLAFINYRGYPGGPSAYEQQMFSIGVDQIGSVSYVLANWLADTLLVWRCVIIYRDFGAVSARVVFAIMGVMQLASYVLGVFFLAQVSSPSSSPYTNSNYQVNWTLPYFCVSLAINVVVTLLVTIRLLLYRRAMNRLLGPGHATECTSVVAVLVESAAVYATFSLLFLVPFALDNSISYAFLQVIGEAQLIAPLLIVYREALGKGWISSSSSVVSSTIGGGERDIRIPRFTDIQFASDLTCSQTGGTRTLESKQDTTFARTTVDVQEVRREEIELGEI